LANFGIRASRSLPNRGPAPGFRFFLYALLAVVLMYLDRTGGWLERVRYGLQAAAYPLQLAVNSPSAAWRWTSEIFEARDKLQTENAALRRRLRELEVRAARNAMLERENAQLRGLRAVLPPVTEKWLAGEVISAESSSLRQRLVINRGAEQGVFKGQSVIAGAGLLGQSLRVGPWSTEIILLTDPEHAVPVQVVRNGLRTLAVGSGEIDALLLPYLPIQSDIREGDELVTSGLGGVFPAGFPVAKVTSVRRDGGSPLAQVRATPYAALDRDREVLFLWFREGHPAAPANEAPDAAAARALGLGPVPPPARPAPAAAASTAAASTVAAPTAPTPAVAAPAGARP
jgi:rod shape-determining protein MreC